MNSGKAFVLDDMPGVEVSINDGCKVLDDIALKDPGTPINISLRPSKIYLLKVH